MTERRPGRPNAVAESAELRFDALVDAYFAASRWTSAVEMLRDYHRAKLRHLEARFGFCLDDVEASVVDIEGAVSLEHTSDVRSLVQIMRNCLRESSTLFAPFGVYLEGGPGPLEAALGHRYGRRFGAEISGLQDTYRQCFCDALFMLAPHMQQKRIPDEIFEILGTEPDPDDFW